MDTENLAVYINDCTSQGLYPRLLTGGFVFVTLNFLSYRRMINMGICCDGFMSFGFPLHWYAFGGYVGMTYIHWWKVALNIIVGFLMCLLTGRLFRGLIVKIRFYVGPA